MSLKAKIEAVIYAAEEPVTLPQLLQLFAPEAIEHRVGRLGQPAPTLDFPDEDLSDEPDSAQSQPTISATGTQEPTDHAASATAQPDSEATALEPTIGESPELDPTRLTRLRERQAREELRLLLSELTAAYSTEDRGLELREVAGGFRFATKPLYHDSVRALIRTLKPPLKLSLPALETLAVIAYKQPITAPEISDVRGVDSAGVLGSLIARKLVTTAGRKAVIGRPILYKTTREFLLRFGLKDLNELPSMEEFEKIAATELNEPEPSEAGPSAPKTAPAQSQLTLHPEALGASMPADPSVQPPAAAPEPIPAPSAARDVLSVPELAPAFPEEELAAQAQSEITVDAEDTPAQTAPDLPGITRDSHGQLPIQSSPGSLIRRPAEEDEAI